MARTKKSDIKNAISSVPKTKGARNYTRVEPFKTGSFHNTFKDDGTQSANLRLATSPKELKLIAEYKKKIEYYKEFPDKFKKKC